MKGLEAIAVTAAGRYIHINDDDEASTLLEASLPSRRDVDGLDDPMLALALLMEAIV